MVVVERSDIGLGTLHRTRGEGSVYLGADGGWHASLRLGRNSSGRPVRRHVRAPSQAEAVRKLTGLRVGAGRETTLGQWAYGCLARVERSVKPSTAKAYRTHIGYLSPIGDLLLGQLEADHLEDLYRDLADRGLAAGTIQSAHRGIRSCLADAVRRGLIDRNPAWMARPPSGHSPEINPLSIEEVRAVLAAAATERNGVRWQIALSLGLRQGEALGLQWADIDLEHSSLSVHRTLQRAGRVHGCAKGGCGLVAADCQRWRAGWTVGSPKSATSRRTVALPTMVTDSLAAHRWAQQQERAAAGEGWP